MIKDISQLLDVIYAVDLATKVFCEIVFVALLAGASAVSSKSSAIPDQDWGYVTINPTYQANMFW